jgi:hypothetical protein
MCFFLKRAPAHATWGQAMLSMGGVAERLEKQLDTVTTREAAVLVRPTDDQSATQTRAEMERALTGMDRTLFRFDVTMDDSGYGWAIVKGAVLGDVAAGINQMGEVFTASGLGERVMAAIFPFMWHDSVHQRDHKIYWLYQPRVRGFTPFVPDGDPGNEQRDHDLEIRMETAIRRDLPTYRDTSEWYPIWGMPI